MYYLTAVTMRLDLTSVRVDEDAGEVTITVLKLGSSELTTAVDVDTKDISAVRKILYVKS